MPRPRPIRVVAHASGWLVLALLTLPSWGAYPVYPGSTHSARQAAYIADQGKQSLAGWQNGELIFAIFGLLEDPDGPDITFNHTWHGQSHSHHTVADLIHEELVYYTDNYEPGECFQHYQAGGALPYSECGIKNNWFTGDHRAPITARMYLEYYLNRGVISPSDAQLLEEKIADITANTWCNIDNWHTRELAVPYLRATRVGGLPPQIPFAADPTPVNCQASSLGFTRNGTTYVPGQTYPTAQLLGDYLEHRIDRWLDGHAWGAPEDHGTYAWAKMHSLGLLADFAPDPLIQKRGAMAFDFFLFDYAVAFSAQHSSGHGRHYWNYEWQGREQIPMQALFDLGGQPAMGENGLYTDALVFKHTLPQLLVDIVEANWKSNSSYYKIVRGRHPAFSWQTYDGSRYHYVTPLYNLGANGFGSGWELSIKSGATPMKLFINNFASDPPTGGPVTEDLGKHGHQHRNAMFVRISPLYLHEMLGGNSWDETASAQGLDANWQFKREGSVAVAIGIAGINAGLEVAILGVDYPSFQAFKNAVTSNASVTWQGFVPSRTLPGMSPGQRITEHYVDGTLPFDRLEVWEGQVGGSEAKIVDWNNRVMSIARGGQSCSYDFNSWTTSGPNCGPEPPDCCAGGGGDTLPFFDGFESGDTSAWSAEAP